MAVVAIVVGFVVRVVANCVVVLWLVVTVLGTIDGIVVVKLVVNSDDVVVEVWVVVKVVAGVVIVVGGVTIVVVVVVISIHIAMCKVWKIRVYVYYSSTVL